MLFLFFFCIFKNIFKKNTFASLSLVFPHYYHLRLLPLLRRLVFCSIGLFVCLSVSNITQKNYEQIVMKFFGGSGVVNRASDEILMVIKITILTVQSAIRPLLNKFRRFLWNFQDSSAMI